MTHNLDLPKVCKITHNLESHKVCKITRNLDLLKVSKIYIKNFFVHSIKIVNLLLNELRLIAKFRESKINFSKARIEKIRKEFNESSINFPNQK